MAVGSALNANGAGRDLVDDDVALGVGFGDGVDVAATIQAGSNRSRGKIDVLADGSNEAQATATVTVTFPEAYDEVPVVVVSRSIEDDASAGDTITKNVIVKSVATTGFVVVCDTIPVDAKTIGFSYVVVG